MVEDAWVRLAGPGHAGLLTQLQAAVNEDLLLCGIESTYGCHGRLASWS
jgi:hypothetical protein